MAVATLSKHGRAARVTWPGVSASLVEDAADTSSAVTIFLGKRTTRNDGTNIIVTIDAIMSPVSRNPVGGEVKIGTATYTILSSDDLGEAPAAIAAHRLVLR